MKNREFDYKSNLYTDSVWSDHNYQDIQPFNKTLDKRRLIERFSLLQRTHYTLAFWFPGHKLIILLSLNKIKADDL